MKGLFLLLVIGYLIMSYVVLMAWEERWRKKPGKARGEKP